MVSLNYKYDKKTEIYSLFSVSDDVFVRKDLLKSKYSFVDYDGAERLSQDRLWWCGHDEEHEEDNQE